MGVFEMVVAIVAISVIGGTISSSIKSKIKANANQTRSLDKETKKHLEEIEKRLIVLEQIVTSEGYELKQQFKNIDIE